MTISDCAHQSFTMILSRRDKLFIALAAAFRSEEIIIAATQAVWIIAADFGTRFIDCTAPRFGIEKLADLFEYMILSLAQHAVAVSDFCISRFGLFVTDLEVFRQTMYVASRGFDSIVAATIGWTLLAIEEHTQLFGFLLWVSVFAGTH